MKNALNVDGIVIKADAAAPREAFCRYCGGKMALRRRRRMGKQAPTFYWRHQDNRNLRCPGRTGPVRQ